MHIPSVCRRVTQFASYLSRLHRVERRQRDRWKERNALARQISDNYGLASPIASDKFHFGQLRDSRVRKNSYLIEKPFPRTIRHPRSQQ